MPKRLSQMLEVDAGELKKRGLFNAFADIDSSLHIDPFLLRHSKQREMQLADAALREHFDALIKVLKHAKKPHLTDTFFREAVKRLTFPEDPIARLGYARGRSGGTGIGPQLAAGMATIALDIVHAGVVDPDIFHLMGLLQEGVGADRISDMAFAIARHNFYRFSADMAEELGTSTAQVRVADRTYALPAATKGSTPLLILSKDVLRDLPVAMSWDDKDVICAYNDELRERVNRLIGTTWREASAKATKSTLARTVARHPDVLRDLLQQYRDKPAEPYDFILDKKGEEAWLELSDAYARHHPLQLAAPQNHSDVAELVRLIRTILLHFKLLVEKKGMWKALYDRNEKMSQLTLGSIADVYCRANNVDVSPEVNSGQGPVDFKFSRGSAARVLVEVKLSSNSHLKHGYKQQIHKYKEAEESHHEFFLVIQVGLVNTQLKDIIAIDETARRLNKRVPELLIIDSQPKASASKAGR